MTSIVSPGSARHFQFDSANRLVCADTVATGCALGRVHYDVDGQRVFDDVPGAKAYEAFVAEGVSIQAALMPGTRIEIYAFGERVAYKTTSDALRTSGLWPAPGGGTLPPFALELLAGLGLAGLLALGARANPGAGVAVLERPLAAGVSLVLGVTLVLAPLPGGRRVAWAGGGGGSAFYWELGDALGTSLVLLDATGARRVHRTYSPFGGVVEERGGYGWLPRHFAGHPEDAESGLVYMRARWLEPRSGTFLSIDPLVSDAGDPQSFNAYAYARNNPVAFVDPTGEAACTNFIFGVYCGAEGGWQAPVWLVAPPSMSVPGPTSMPLDSIGNPLAGAVQLGGGGQAGAPSLNTSPTANEPQRDGRSLADQYVDEITHGHVDHLFEHLKVLATPLVMVGTGVSTVLIGIAIIAGSIPGGPTGAPAMAAGGVLVGIGVGEIDAGLAASNQVYGTEFQLGPLSRSAAGGDR